MMHAYMALICTLLLVACEKNVSFNLHPTSPRIVIEATIENGRAPVVIVSHSLDYFSTISPTLLAASFVHQAVIDISNGVHTHRLQEYAVPLGGDITFYYYSIDSSSLNTAFMGQPDHAYQLKLQVDGQAFSTHTTIPPLAKKIDSFWWVKAPANPDTTRVVLMGRITDPRGYGNYTRYFMQVDRQPFYPGLNSIFDNQVVDGTTYNVQIEKGVDRNKVMNLDNYAFFNRGDSVTVKYCNIDKATFDFWRTMEYTYSSIGNPFSSPTRVMSNIGGGGLGYFGGYVVQYISLKIP